MAAAAEKMTMGEETVLASLTMPILVGPSIACLEKRGDAGSGQAAQVLKAAFAKAEAAHPGLCHQFINGLVKKTEIKVNMNEILLKVQGSVNESESSEFRVKRPEDSFQVHTNTAPF